MISHLVYHPKINCLLLCVCVCPLHMKHVHNSINDILGQRFLYFNLTREQTIFYIHKLRIEMRFLSIGLNINYPPKNGFLTDTLLNCVYLSFSSDKMTSNPLRLLRTRRSKEIDIVSRMKIIFTTYEINQRNSKWKSKDLKSL